MHSQSCFLKSQLEELNQKKKKIENKFLRKFDSCSTVFRTYVFLLSEVNFEQLRTTSKNFEQLMGFYENNRFLP